MSFPGTNIPNRQSIFRMHGAGPEFYNDPTTDNINWVTVELPSSLNDTHTDQLILEYVILEIQSGHATIHRVAQHAFRYECISFPLDDLPDSYSPEEARAEIMTQAEMLATYWLMQVNTGKASLDRARIFCIGFMDPHYGEETEETED
ncbi:Cwf15/Cwc15 cell cycle control protein [Penicillium concentricum]|uniref:Cwf15/Cwc15 cell cycle control protein n=1 Tax=Penicillium concentricum TaxID=293559 RepID=A0A9W9RIH9_9EURO|nr:Cwf15/Cwc15 cell cycle control protein [Penicillium concentricum]KAJ5359924.1 Cwf15/Cwc15 cell cycle control protein [Penicillium concentricum]